MKKTLIALAVAASAVVSGSAMAAWTANGGGGQVEIGGSLTPVTKATPWETAVGAAVTNLNGQVQKNDTKLEITVPKTLLSRPFALLRSLQVGLALFQLLSMAGSVMTGIIVL